MGKRSTVVVLSSDEEDENRSPSLKRSYAKPKSKASVTRTNPRGAKKARISGSRSRLSKEFGSADEVGLFCDNFDEVFYGFKVSAGSGRNNTKELWVDKHKPHSLEELAVHKKKIEEVKTWFEERLKASKENFSNHVLVVTGQAGIGKSATIRVIASHLGARLCEWNTPTPTLWQEHVHNSNTGIRYTSKLDEFENFVERIRKYGLISSSFTGESKSSAILLIDDLPVTNGKVAYGRLRNCLHLLVRSTRVPTAILVTDYGKSDSPDNTTRSLEELQLFLERAGACKVVFNPITNNAIKRILARICRLELCNVDAEQIDLMAKASGGDIRHAITSLQFFCLKPDPMLSLSLSNPTPTNSKEHEDELKTSNDGFSLPFGRDETLSLFHALGKFLHNKRESGRALELDQHAFLVREEFARLPLKMDAPEIVLCQAHGQARPIADFLHENVLDFLSEEAIGDAWAVASYLGDADILLSTFHGMLARHNETENVLQSAASSVAVRGVLFGNSHPLPSRWHAIRRPQLWHVEQSSLQNKREIMRQRLDYNGVSLFDMTVMATEFTPAHKVLGYGASEGFEARQELILGTEIENDNIDRMSLDDPESEISNDEIEDW